MNGLVVDLQTGMPKFRTNIWCEFEGTITAGNTLTIDTLPLLDFNNLTYEMTFTGPTSDDVKSLSMKAQKRVGKIKETIYGRLGQMSINLDTNISGSDYELNATNNEAYDVEYCLTVLTV
jgi:hypothetical protein